MKNLIELTSDQKRTVYQVLQKYDLECYQPQIEEMMLGRLPPVVVLDLIRLICEEIKTGENLKRVDIKNEILRKLNNPIGGIKKWLPNS